MSWLHHVSNDPQEAMMVYAKVYSECYRLIGISTFRILVFSVTRSKQTSQYQSALVTITAEIMGSARLPIHPAKVL